MTSFADVETTEPEFAARVRAAFAAHRHTFLATLRADGAPRISGIETQFRDGELWLAGMSRSVKFADLRRDPRMALHSGSNEPDTFTADAKVSGRAIEVTDPAELAAFAAGSEHDDAESKDGEQAGGGEDFELFRVDLEQVVLTGLNEERDALVIASWRPGRGITRAVRT